MTYKKLKTVTHEIELKNGEILEIRLPANYQIIFDNVRMGKANYATARLYENFVTQYTRLDRYGKEKFQDFANSGNFRTEDVCEAHDGFFADGKFYGHILNK